MFVYNVNTTYICVIFKINNMKNKLYSFRFNPKVIEQIDKLAKNTHRNRTNYIEFLMLKDIKDKKELENNKK